MRADERWRTGDGARRVSELDSTFERKWTNLPTATVADYAASEMDSMVLITTVGCIFTGPK